MDIGVCREGDTGRRDERIESPGSRRHREQETVTGDLDTQMKRVTEKFDEARNVPPTASEPSDPKVPED